MKDKGYIALYRKFLDWEWFTDINTCHLFLYCLLRANHTNTVWRGIAIKKGQFITSYSSMSEETGLTYKQVRLGIDKLKRTGEVAHEGHSSYSIITIKNYNTYQDKGQTKGQSKGSQRATDNNDNNENKNISNISYINSLSLISEGEREILKNYLLRQKRKPDNLDAYIKHLISNGDYKEILEKEKKRLQRLEEKKQQIVEIKRVELTKEDEEEILKIQQRMREKIRRG